MTKSVISQRMRESLEDLAAGKPLENIRHMTTKVYVVPVSPNEVKATRAHLKFSQNAFADWLGVSLQAVQAWEQGRRTPEAVVSKVIRLANQKKEFVVQFNQAALAGATR